ncbi:hypothetical protein BGZ74_007197 [Mortierella antarctica]|nr:hypothetical protein BGZ74_007197 [Mortierella antarctica]
MDAVSTALSSQDILHQILSLGSLAQADLRACCLVNSDWAATGLALLWRHPQCHTLLAFRLLLDTLRHEQDQPARVLLPSTHSRERSVRRASTMHSPSPSARTLTSSQSLAILPTPYRPHCPPKEYGIPFHGKRSYHRAQFIRTLDLHAVSGYLSLHHLEILARSSRIGLRALDLQTIQLPFSEHLLAILVASKQLRSLTLGPIELPSVENLSYLKPCLGSLTELRLMSCLDTVDDDVLGFLLRHSPQLRQLEIHGEKFTDRSLEFIATTCVELESLVLEAPLMTDVVIAQITTGCTKLKTWRLIDCTELSETTVELLETMYDWDKTPKGIRGGFAGLLTGSPSSIASLAGATGAMSLATSPSSTSLSSAATLISQSSSPSSSASSISTSAHSESDVSQSHKSHQQRQGSNNSMSNSGGGPTREEHSFLLEQHIQLSPQQQYRQQQLLLQPTAGLSTLEFRNCFGIHPFAINSILRAQPRLEHLTLGGPKITDDSLTCLTEAAYPHLRTLELFDCSEVSDETMVATLFNCDRLTKVGIRGSNFTYRTFSGIAMHLEMLEELHLEHVRLIINETLQDIMLRCSRLRVLKLWHCRNLTQDLFTDQMDPVSSLEVLEYMDKYMRLFNQPGRDQPGGGRQGGAGAGGGSGASVGWESQVRFLQTLVIRFENLRVLRLGKIAETYVPVNLVSYLCQLDRLEKFSIFQNPCLDLIDLKELQSRLPTLIEVGVGQSDKLSEEDILRFNQSNHRPNVLMYRRLLESSDELVTYAYKPNLNA